MSTVDEPEAIEDVLTQDAQDLVHIAGQCFDEPQFNKELLSKKVEIQTNKLVDYNVAFL